MNAASSLDKNATSLATSSALPNRFSGILFKVVDAKPSIVALSRPAPDSRFVLIGPGQTAFILMPLGASSVEATLTTAFKAALLAEYTEEFDCPVVALMDESKIMAPPR